MLQYVKMLGGNVSLRGKLLTCDVLEKLTKVCSSLCCVYILSCQCLCMCACVRVCVYMCLCVCMCVCIHAFVRACVCVCAHVYVYICVYSVVALCTVKSPEHIFSVLLQLLVILKIV